MTLEDAIDRAASWSPTKPFGGELADLARPPAVALPKRDDMLDDRFGYGVWTGVGPVASVVQPFEVLGEESETTRCSR